MIHNNFCGWRKGWNISKKKNLTLMAPALPNPRVVPHISADHFAEHVAFIWHLFAMYLTFLLLIFLLFFCPYRYFAEGVAFFRRLFTFLIFHIFARYKQSLKVSRNNPRLSNIQCIVYLWLSSLGCPKKTKSLNFVTQLTPVVFIG